MSNLLLGLIIGSIAIVSVIILIYVHKRGNNAKI